MREVPQYDWGDHITFMSSSKGLFSYDMDVTHPVGPTSGSWDQLSPLGAFRGPPGPAEDTGPPKGPFWTSVGTSMVQEWAKMSYNYVLCMSEVFLAP